MVWIHLLCVLSQVVAPKKEKLAQAEAELAVQMEKLNAKRAQLKEVCYKLSKGMWQFVVTWDAVTYFQLFRAIATIAGCCCCCSFVSLKI